jgi:hypothetical protein
MAYQVASSCDFCGLPWSGYVCCEGLQPSQPKDNDIETDVSQHYYPYCESFASSSSFPDLSLSGSAELTSASSSASEVDFTDFMKQKTGDFGAMDPSTSRSGLMAAETTTHSDVNGYVDPRLVVSGLPSCNNPNTSDHMGNATLGGSPVQRFYNDFRPPLVDQVSSLQYPTNDFDIALSEVQSTIHAFKPGLNLWLRTWVATNPQKFPNNQEIESLRTLSGLSEAEIVTCLSEHVPTQVASAAEVMDTELTIRDAEQTYQKRPPRYRPKCRRSRRRFRYVAETQDETRIFECTHRCGQSFARKGQWTRHERSNVEGWRCDRCDFVSARKDKLRSHLMEAHSLRGGPRKSHCRQLLQPSARRCGFCQDRFENWSAWLNHISAHFEGHIAGGPWTMARWNRAVDPDFGSSESDDDDDDDNDDDDDDDQAGNEEDQDDPDYGNSATDQTGNSSSKGKDASYGSGSKGSSRSSSKSKSKSSGSRSSKSHRGASRALSYLQQDYYTSQSDHGCKLARSHTMSPLKPRKADLVPLGGEGNRGFLRYKKPDRPVVQSSQTCSSKDSSGVEMESVSSILPPHERERRQDQPLRLSAVNSNIGYGDAMSGVFPLPKALVMQQNNVTPPGMTLPHAASHRNNPIVDVADAGKSTSIAMLGSALRNFTMFKKLCGEDCFRSVSLGTTFWDMSKPHIAEAREMELKTKEEFWGDMISRGSKVCRVPDDQESARQLLCAMVQRESMTPKIQKELVDEEKKLDETVAGLSFFELEMGRMKEEYGQQSREMEQRSKTQTRKEEETAREKEALKETYEEKLAAQDYAKEKLHQEKRQKEE